MKTNIHKEQKREATGTFLGLIGGFVDSVDKAIIEKTISGPSGENHPEFKRLVEYWYETVELGEPDFGVYDNPLYLIDLFNCWNTYSKQYIRALEKRQNLFKRFNVETVLDLGCGIGMTTRSLGAVFPSATITGTNLPDTLQWNIAQHHAAEAGFTVTDHLVEADAVFASEYFEHLEIPIDHLDDVVAEVSPKVMIIANTFAGDAIGHFNNYLAHGRTVEGKKVQRLFTASLKNHGYEKIETGFWNGRPSVWVRD